jgi:Zn-dependent peptidase ImmA (M78 family)
VNLSRLEDAFPLLIEDLSGMDVAGYVIPPDGDISPDNTAPVYIHKRLGPIDRRLAYAHEVGHALHGHAGALTLRQLDEWFLDRAELEAWRVAAQLLIPVEAIVQFETVDRIARACLAPPELVKLL